jgi:hypothetical protein
VKFQERAAIAALTTMLLLAPGHAKACACGCGVFDVGAGSLLAPGQRGVVSLEYDLQDQTQNWNGAGRAGAAGNPDKRILTHFIKVAGEYMLSSDWSVIVDIPIADRTFHTVPDGGINVAGFRDTALGDARIMADFTGLAEDLSTGLTFGVQLPTGDMKARGFDRDTQIGSGSTDLLFGAYHRGALSTDAVWNYFVQGVVQIPVTLQGGYRPGQEFNGAAGLFFDGFVFGGGRFKISPALQMIVSARAPDAGALADRPNSGYERLMVSPGLQLAAGEWRAYGDVELPVYQRVNGDQLVSPVLVKLAVSRGF